MAEILCALWVLLAAAQFGNYLRHPGWRTSSIFALLALAAILTKANGGALALVPPLAILLSRRWELLRRAHFWGAAIIVAILCGPWYALTAGMAQQGWRRGELPGFLLKVARFNWNAQVEIAGPWLLALAIVGLVVFVGRDHLRPQTADPRVPALAALWISVFLFHTYVLPVQETRHLLMAAPAILSFAFSTVAWLAAADRGWRLHPVTAALATAAMFGITTFRVPPKPAYGSRYVVDAIRASPELAAARTIFISSEASGEGAFIAEMAMLIDQPKPRIRRASKLLVQSDWGGFERTALVHTPRDIVQTLEKNQIDVVVVDLTHSRGSPNPEHHLLLRTLREDKVRFHPAATGKLPPGTPFRIYLFSATGRAG